jgi:hypothetical protein
VGYIETIKPATVKINLDAIVRAVKKKGACSAKQLAYEMGRTEGWAGAYLVEAVKRGKLVTDGAYPQHFSVPGHLKQKPRFEIKLKKDTITLLKVLKQVFDYETVEEAAEKAIRGFAVKVSLEHKINLNKIAAEIKRHDEKMNLLMAEAAEESTDDPQ